MGLTIIENFLKSILDLFRSSTSSGTRSASVNLTGVSTSLPDYACRGVMILNSCTLVTGSGTAITFPGGTIPCNNTSEIFVSGSGTLNYLILL